MAILTHSGRAALASALMQRPLHLAWGTGDPDWDALPDGIPPPESVTTTALISEIGRRSLSQVSFVLPSDTGMIELPYGRWNTSVAPTRYLYLKTAFDFADAPNAVFREVGVFLDTEVVAGLPIGQRYFIPAQIADPGLLLALEYVPAVARAANIRQTFEFVLEI